MALHHYTLAGALLFAASTASAAPCAGFLDVEDTSPFCANVEWLRNRGVTNGCGVDTYCPDQPVTRLQMAAFMNRLANSLFPLTCASGQVMKWNGASWACADDANSAGGGTVTSVLAGTGLQGSPNPIIGAGAINVDTAYVQRRVSSSCAAGYSIRAISEDGTVTCQADTSGTGTVTSVTAGPGLTGGTITGAGTIAADTSILQQRISGTCAIGSSIRAIAADGTVTCHTDNTGPATVQRLETATNLNLTSGAYLCETEDIPAATYARWATLIGITNWQFASQATGMFTFTVLSRYSIDSGLNWLSAPGFQSNSTFGSSGPGERLAIPTLSPVIPLEAGRNYRFAWHASHGQGAIVPMHVDCAMRVMIDR